MLPCLPILDLLQDCCDPPLTPETLELLQATLDRRFPREYSEFLLRFNGGHFVRTVEFSIPNPTKFVTGGLMRSFFGEPNDGYEHYGLVSNAEVLSDRIPQEYLVIGDCNGSDHVLLKLVGPESRFEGVWYWDSSAFWISEDEQAFYWLADSFYEFLGMLIHDVCTIEDEYETLPIFQAVERGALSSVESYLAQGGPIEARNERGHTLLMAAAIYRWPKLVRLLLDHNADPNSRDSEGRSPLQHAALHSLDSVKLVLQAGGDATARDQQGKSVVGGWCYRADQILRAHGAQD
jgi:hypothetical protein